MIALFAFIFGLVIGSFLNVVIYRVPRGQSIAFPPSHCPGCDTHLKPMDLVPVFSWLFLKGRCRHCGAGISIRYPLIELFTALIFLLLSLNFWGWQLISLLILSSVLIVAAVIDYEHGIIPNKLLLTGFIIGLIIFLFRPVLPLSQHLLGVLAGGLPLLLLAALSRGGMGGGDIKLAAVMGLYLGPKLMLTALFLGSLLAGLTGIVFMLAGKKTRKDTMVFGPFLALGAVVSIFWGREILFWYLSMF